MATVTFDNASRVYPGQERGLEAVAGGDGGAAEGGMPCLHDAQRGALAGAPVQDLPGQLSSVHRPSIPCPALCTGAHRAGSCRGADAAEGRSRRGAAG